MKLLKDAIRAHRIIKKLKEDNDTLSLLLMAYQSSVEYEVSRREESESKAWNDRHEARHLHLEELKLIEDQNRELLEIKDRHYKLIASIEIRELYSKAGGEKENEI
jgi:hypothetical protein